MPRIDHNKFYYNAYKRYGKTPQALCWKDKHSQKERFLQISKALPKDLSSFSLVDCGCGFGDLYHFLQKRNNLPKHYIGIEEQSLFAKIAQKQTQQKIIVGDFLQTSLPEADFYICSGTLNTLTHFESYLFLTKMAQNATQGVIFNFLSKTDSDHFNALDPKKVKELLAQLRFDIYFYQEGYIQNDCTIAAQPYHQL